MKRTILHFCYLLTAAVTAGQAVQKERMLTWDDYQGTVPKATYFAATTVSYVKLSYAPPLGGSISKPVYIWCEFSRGKSWVNRSVLYQKRYQRLLQHEVNHYRLNIICAKTLKKSIDSYKKLPQQTLQALTKTITETFDTRNREYDAQTNHGSIASRQLEWEKQIALEMKALEDIMLIKP